MTHLLLLSPLSCRTYAWFLQKFSSNFSMKSLMWNELGSGKNAGRDPDQEGQ
jgi:hypothetical protein